MYMGLICENTEKCELWVNACLGMHDKGDAPGMMHSQACEHIEN